MSLFGSNGVTPEDIRQGAVGNCWLMGGASAVAEVPGRMENVFLNNGNCLSEQGIYGVNIYTLGVPHTIIVDDYLPLREVWNGWSTLFAHIGDDNSLWGPILEKAMAKFHGNYNHLEGGNPVYSVRTLTGAPYEMLFHRGWSTVPATSAETLWERLVAHDGSNDILQAGTPGSSDQARNEFGLSNNHAYTVLGVKTMSTGEKLIKMRNPWGVETYSGDFSDASELWTRELIDETGREIDDDGIFYMPLEAYHAQVEQTFISYDTSDWFQGYYLKLNDTTQNKGKWSTCGSSCTRHELFV